MRMHSVLTIAGSDCSGGAGIEADLKTIQEYRFYGQAAITAITAQNTMGVTAVEEVSPEMVRAQIDAVFADIVPDSVKIGMVGSPEQVDVIADTLGKYVAEHGTPVVVDPVMVATSGAVLVSDETRDRLCEKLFPLALMITPNMGEAAHILGCDVAELQSREGMQRAASELHERFGCAVLLKGGHMTDCADDFLVDLDGQGTVFECDHIDTPNTHGTGCTLSTALAVLLGIATSDLYQVVASAKAYVYGAIEHDLHLGRGTGPINHMWERWEY